MGRMAVALLCLCALEVVSSLRIPLHHRPHVRKQTVERILSGRYTFNPKASTPIDHMRNIGDTEYVANISVGTPPQTFSLIMDTGSGNVWVSSIHCKPSIVNGCGKMNRFDEAKSTTYQNESTPFLLVYGTGFCAGHLFKDSLGLTPQGPYIKGQEMGDAIEVAPFFKNVPDCDGIWGMGLQALAQPNTIVPPLKNMETQGIVTSRSFGVFLDSVDGDLGSEITWGEIDKKHYTGELKYFHYVPFPVSYMYYMVAWEAITFKGVKMAGFDCGLACLAVVDTGTSLIVGPEATVQAINGNLSIAEDCSNFGKGEPLVIRIGTTEFSIPPTVYMIKDPDTKKCASGIMGTPIYQGFWIFGDTFLRSVYTVFDNDKMRFGMAPSAAIANWRRE